MSMSTKRDSKIGLPLSSVSRRASSSACASTRSPSFQSRRERSMGLSFAHGPSSAARAARTARSTSSAPASATVVMGSSVAGFTVVNVAPDAASTATPSIMSRPGLTGASVSDIELLRGGRAFHAGPLDLVGVVPIVLGKSPHHVAERVAALPDDVWQRGHLGHAQQQLLAERVEPAHGLLPGVGAERRAGRLVHRRLLRILDPAPRPRLTAERPPDPREPHPIALGEVE